MSIDREYGPKYFETDDLSELVRIARTLEEEYKEHGNIFEGNWISQFPNPVLVESIKNNLMEDYD